MKTLFSKLGVTKNHLAKHNYQQQRLYSHQISPNQLPGQSCQAGTVESLGLGNSANVFSSTNTSPKIKNLFTQRCDSTSSLYSGWAPQMFAAFNLMESIIGEALATNQMFLLASDADGTLIHSKAPIHKAIVSTYSEYNMEVDWHEDISLQKIHGPQDKVFQQMFEGTTVCPKEANTKYEQKLETFYSQETTLMPDVMKFLLVGSILRKYKVMGFSIISFMNHGPLNLAAQNLGIMPRFTKVVEGSQGAEMDKDTPLIFTRRVYPKLAEDGFTGSPLKVLCIGDSRYSDRVMAENVPDKKGVYIAFSNKKDEGGKLLEETGYPWISDWNMGAMMLALAALKALEQVGPQKIGYTRSEQMKRDLQDSVGIGHTGI